VTAAATPALRRDFDLPEDDAEGLDAGGLRWETVIAADNGAQAHWVLIHDFPLPSGYAPQDLPGAPPVGRVTVAVRVTGYPGGALDMVHVSPRLRRNDGVAVPNLGDMTIDGQPFQQWSRHYTPANPFRVGIDSLITHLSLAEEWFAREFRR
jgi:hypothetical protein